MKKNKFLLNTSIILAICSTTFIAHRYNLNTSIKKTSNTMEDIIEDSNFKLEFKNLNELEFTVQDSTLDIKNTGLNKTFSNNQKFDILINNSGKISSISFNTETDDINDSDIEYLQKIYNFVFGNISSYIFENTEDILKKVQSPEYISANKIAILDNGYTIESLNLRKTSEIKFTTYYKKINNELRAYKVNLDILQGSKW